MSKEYSKMIRAAVVDPGGGDHKPAGTLKFFNAGLSETASGKKSLSKSHSFLELISDCVGLPLRKQLGPGQIVRSIKTRSLRKDSESRPYPSLRRASQKKAVDMGFFKFLSDLGIDLAMALPDRDLKQKPIEGA